MISNIYQFSCISLWVSLLQLSIIFTLMSSLHCSLPCAGQVILHEFLNFLPLIQLKFICWIISKWLHEKRKQKQKHIQNKVNILHVPLTILFWCKVVDMSKEFTAQIQKIKGIYPRQSDFPEEWDFISKIHLLTQSSKLVFWIPSLVYFLGLRWHFSGSSLKDEIA